MPTGYLPARESELVTWTANFGSQLVLHYEDYALTQAQVETFSTLRTNFDLKYQAASDPTTRSPTNIQIKNEAKTALLTNIRQLVPIIQQAPGMTNATRTALGITVKDSDPTPVPPPETAPVLDIVSVSGRVVTYALHASATGSKRRKPAGVQGATVFTYVGEEPAMDLADWKFQGSTTKNISTATFDATVPAGSKVWLTAFWFNRKTQSGPACQPVSTHVQFGSFSQAA